MDVTNIFDNVTTLQSLQTAIASGDKNRCLLSQKNALLKCDNPSQSAKAVIYWLNQLIYDYNRLIGTNNNGDIYSSYDRLLFEVINEFMLFLPTQGQLFALVNNCILTDNDKQKDFHEAYFEKSLDEMNRFITKISRSVEMTVQISDLIYATIGFLNARAHKYDDAQKNLENCIAILNKKLSSKLNDQYVERFIAAQIHLATCFEYRAYHNEYKPFEDNDISSNKMKDLATALSKLLGNDQEEINSSAARNGTEIYNCIISYYNNSLFNCSLSQVGVILKFISKNDYHTLNVFDLQDNEYVRELQNEFVHETAHCLSEYAATIVINGEKTDSNLYPLCSILQLISRFLMDWLVAKGNNQYITCQATVRAENDACPEAIDILLKRIAVYENEHHEKDKISDEEAELQFYIFYFAEQELRTTYNDDYLKEVFYKYGNKFVEYAGEDNDRLFHYYVIYFRYLLKQMSDRVLRSTGFDNAGNATNNEYEIDEIHKKLIVCKDKISKHVFQPLQDECARLIELYYFFRQFRWLYIVDNDDRSSLLAELATVLCVYHGYDDDDLNDEKSIAYAIKKIYNEIFEPKKILILAPIYSAPSCSFSVHNIDSLLKIETKPLPIHDLDVHRMVAITMAERENLLIDDGRYVKIKSNIKAHFKWTISYRDNKLFLFYNDIYNDHNNSMFPIVFTENERIQYLKLLEELFGCRSRNKRCDNPINYCRAGYNLCCISIYTVSDTDIHEKLINLLIFLEFELNFYKDETNTHQSRLKPDDVIVMYYRPGIEEYRIVGYSQFNWQDMRNQICELCTFTNNQMEQQATRTLEHSFRCKHNKDWFDVIKNRLEIQKGVANRNGHADSSTLVKKHKTLLAQYDTFFQMGKCDNCIFMNNNECNFELDLSQLGIDIEV